MKEYKFKIGGKEYNVTVNPKEGKFFDVTVNGTTYEVEAENAPAAAPVAQPVAAPAQAENGLPLCSSRGLSQSGRDLQDEPEIQGSHRDV